MPRNRRNRKDRTRPRSRLRRIAVLPALATLMNAVFGFAAIHFTARGMNEPNKAWLERPELTFFAVAAYLLFLAMIADSLDGQLARLSGSASNFGIQLDSLADMVSFGVAPAFLVLRVVENGLPQLVGPVSPVFGSFPGRLLWLTTAMYMCCAALRLARFNVETTTEEASHTGFSGLPAPAAAAAVASLVLLYGDLFVELENTEGLTREVARVGSWVIIYALPFVTAAVALLMVSRVPYVHMVNRVVRGRKSFGYLVLVVLIMLFLWWKLQLTLAIGAMAFVASGPVRWFWRRRRGRIEQGSGGPGEIKVES